MQRKFTRPLGIIPKQDYEAALGEFLLSFNELEALVGKLLVASMENAGRAALGREIAMKSMLAKKIDYLRALATDDHLLADINLSGIEKLLNERNIVAHGHLEVGPIDRSYAVLGNKGRRTDIDEAFLYALSDQARAFSSALGLVLLRYYKAAGLVNELRLEGTGETHPE